MLPYFNEIYGNPANGLHVLGRKAARSVENAREQVAELIGARPGEVVFTSGATESNHLAILGTAEYAPPHRRKIITCAIEHKAVLAPCSRLTERGFEVVVLPVGSDGVVSLEALELALGDNTFLVSIQAANNEIGTLQFIPDIANMVHKHGAFLHTDAAQAVGKILFSVSEWGVDMLSFSAHKMYGPKGIGALYLRGGARATPIRPLLAGGGQESGLRAGTSNVPAIVGFGEACRILGNELDSENECITNLRDSFERELRAVLSSVKINGQGALRLPNTSSLTIPGVEADALLLNMPDLMLGTGSACSSGAVEPSHVLLALGLSRSQAASTVRASLGRFTGREDIERAVTVIAQAVKEQESHA
jgi:cysteine desulfurase